MKNTNLTLDLRSYSRETNAHQHDYHQLVLPVTGRLEMNIGDKVGDVSVEQGAIIPAGQAHGFAAHEVNCFVVADVPIALAPALEHLPAFIPIDAALAQYVIFLHQKLRQGDSSKNSERQMLLLLVQMLRERFGGVIHLDRRIEAACAHLDQYFNQSVSLAQLAIIASISPRQLSELFSRQLGMTPQQYLIEKRMQMAWKMIEGSDLSVQQIANRAGYKSLSAFSDRFRKHFGHSPRHFRQISK